MKYLSSAMILPKAGYLIKTKLNTLTRRSKHLAKVSSSKLGGTTGLTVIQGLNRILFLV